MKVILKSVPSRKSVFPARRASLGIALIVTLIMLSVITFMTVTFLVLSQRERGAVTTSTDQLIAKQSADSAFERAKIELLAPMLALTNPHVYDLLVSTNYVNPYGFNPSLPNDANPYTNVNFDYRDNKAQLEPDDRIRVLQNLLYNPRVPVWMTNQTFGINESRFYLDLNRNGRYDTNGYLPELDINGNPIVINGATNYGWYVGDPEWIGVLERPELPHSASNRFVARYAYSVIPAGKTLDVNYIHNQAKRPGNPNDDGFLRNQGVGSYEINLAAFLTDLNPNFWNPTINPYIYRTNGFSDGVGFQDALALLQYRYGRPTQTYMNLSRARDIFTNFAVSMVNDGIDQYSDGPLMLGNKIDESSLPDPVVNPWAGSDNPIHYFTTQEFFDPDKTSIDFAKRLSDTGTNLSSFNRYTFSRMQAQLGTDSEPDRRMNINYRNVDDNMNVVPGMETNLFTWTPIQFFTNAADRLLRAQFPYLNISVTNIPVFEDGQLKYSPVVQRLLQVAANMYEATTNSLYPTLFRPYFEYVDDILYIRGFEEVVNPVINHPFLALPPLDVQNREVADWIAGQTGAIHRNIYGIPWIIGARKGLPNLNEISANNRFNITRRVVAQRDTRASTGDTFTFSEQYLIDLWTELGVETWNSYHTNFPGAEIHVRGVFGYSLTNNNRGASVSFSPTPIVYNITVSTNDWPGYSKEYSPSEPAAPASFIVPLRTNFTMVVQQVYDPNGNTFHTNSSAFYPVSQFPIRWGLNQTNCIQVIICDRETKRIFDYVQLRGPSMYRDLSEQIRTAGVGFDGLWNTNVVSGLPEGIVNQIGVSRGSIGVSDSDWNQYGVNQLASGTIRDKEIATFKAFYFAQRQSYNGVFAENPTNLWMQLPFTPTRSVSQEITWQANDPLVHYLADDLAYIGGTLPFNVISPPGTITNLLPNIGMLNDRYNPWGGSPPKGLVNIRMDANPALKDPGVRAPRDWDFPTNKLPNLGWLGRVHRGTPWQTVYLKAENVISNNAGLQLWREWTGHANIIAATNTAPINDRLIFDLFTTAPNYNAGRGRLPVNQTNLAAWSAVLSGVMVISNDAATGALYPMTIEPAAVSPQVAGIVDGIVRTKSLLLTNNSQVFEMFPQRQFTHLGDVFAVPEFTDASPFLDVRALRTKSAGGITDAVMERIPQQILSLLSLPQSPRFVIYSYGQALRPAEQSIVRSFGPYYGLCTNYQVTAESAMRAVVRVEGSFDPRDATNSVPLRRYPPRLIVEQYNLLPPD